MNLECRRDGVSGRLGSEGTPTSHEPFLCQLGGEWVLYHPLTDRLLVLNATARATWDLLNRGFKEREIASAFAEHFGISEERAVRDVTQVVAHLEDHRAYANLDRDHVDVGVAMAQGGKSAHAVGHNKSAQCGVFRLGRSRIRVLSSVAELDESFFLRFQHRATEDDPDAETLEVSVSGSVYRMTFRGRVLGEAATIHQAMWQLVDLLLSLEHPQRAPLAYCHAGAVSRGGQSLLMPGGSGVGKSTLTAFLAAQGFSYLGDDGIAIGEDDMSLLPLPTCLSIKAGSWAVLEPYYPALPKLTTVNRYGRSIRYVDPHGSYESRPTAAAPSAIVFPVYCPGTSTRLIPLRPSQTMIQLLEAHARLLGSATKERLGKLVRFVERTPAYELNYSELPGAMSAIEDMLASQP